MHLTRPFITAKCKGANPCESLNFKFAPIYISVCIHMQQLDATLLCRGLALVWPFSEIFGEAPCRKSIDTRSHLFCLVARSKAVSSFYEKKFL